MTELPTTRPALKPLGAYFSLKVFRTECSRPILFIACPLITLITLLLDSARKFPETFPGYSLRGNILPKNYMCI